jgi:hypothetical protein
VLDVARLALLGYRDSGMSGTAATGHRRALPRQGCAGSPTSSPVSGPSAPVGLVLDDIADHVRPSAHSQPVGA